MTAVSVINAIIERLNHTIVDHLYVELASEKGVCS